MRLNVDYGEFRRQFVRLGNTKDKVNGQKHDIIADYPSKCTR